jgi:predicted sulfurtransferase
MISGKRRDLMILPLRFTVALALTLGVTAASHAQTTPDDLSQAPRIAQAAFKRLLQMDEVFVIDVRDAGSYSLGHIPGAVLMPLDTLPKHVEALKASKKPIVAYCA